MRGREEMSILCIHKNLLAVQKLRLAKLSQANSEVSSNLSAVDKIDAKKSCFHVFVKGYNSYTLFYDNEDKVYFLSVLDEAAQKTQAKISAFILMDNHFHLQVTTSHLSDMMNILLFRYSHRFKRKYGFDGPVFKCPFGRSQIFSYLLAKENLLYILSNASRERTCANHRDYIWSSYNSHPEVIHLRKNGMLPLLGKTYSSVETDSRDVVNPYPRDPLPTPKRRIGKLPSAKKIAQNDVSQILKVDTSFMISAFRNFEDFDYTIHSYEPLNSKKNKKFVKLTPDSDIISFLMNLLGGRMLSSLTSYERSQIIQILNIEKRATRRQISSIMRMSY